MGTFRRLWLHRSAAIGMVIVGLALFCALFCHWLAPFSPVEQYRSNTLDKSKTSIKAPPGRVLEQDYTVGHEVPEQLVGRRFLLGTDSLGRDVLSRVLYGARLSLLVGVVATLLNVLIGVLIGTVAGYFGGWTDTVLMRLTDTFFAFPGMVLAIILLATLRQPEVLAVLKNVSGGIDPGIWGLFLALGLTGWTGIARVIRGQVLALKEEEFIEAARAIGCSNKRIILVHLIPNCLAPIIVLGTMQIAYNILSEAGLSFLGLGIQPPEASWGGMLAEGRAYLTTMWWWGLFPGIALAITVLGFNLFGDGLRDVLDPRLKTRS